MNFDNLKKVIDEPLNSSISNINKSFGFENKYLDNHIENIKSICEASYAQVSMASLTTIGFILAHADIKNTSLYFCDLSDSATGKSFNMTLQFKLLLQEIEKLQDSLQLSCDNEDGIKRYHNIHRGKITVPALNQCIKTVKTQILVIDELGLLMQRGSDIIDEVTKLYGIDSTSLSITKGEVPNSKNIVPVAFSFMGATTLSYFGGTKTVMKELLGGFINRQLLSYNTQLKKPEDITSIFKDTLDYKTSNEQSMKLFNFAKTNNIKFHYSKESEKLQLNFKKEVQSLKLKYHDMGTQFGAFYSRIEQNLQIVLNIVHVLYCFEKDMWIDEINKGTTKIVIDFFKEVVFIEIDKLINYLSDGELLERQEKQILKIKEFTHEYLEQNSTMPKVRDVSLKTRLSKQEILDLSKDFLELIPGSTQLRYCER